MGWYDGVDFAIGGWLPGGKWGPLLTLNDPDDPPVGQQIGGFLGGIIGGATQPLILPLALVVAALYLSKK